MKTMKSSQPFQPSFLHRRRNSMNQSLLPTDLHIPSKHHTSSFPPDSRSSFSPVDLELISIKQPPYTSLKDLLPSLSSAQSPTTPSAQSIYDISIRNHLVKQAALAYLQPMCTSPGCGSQYSLRRIWASFSTDYVKNPVNACFGFLKRRVVPTLTRVFDRFLGVIRVRIISATR